MPKQITYGGPTSRDDISTEFVVRDESGKPHTLRKGYATEVPDDVAKRLLGDDAPKGHKFAQAQEGDRLTDGSVVEAESTATGSARTRGQGS